MNQTEKNELKDKIEEVLTQVLDDIVRLKDITKPIAPENSLGRISRMDAINNKSVNEATLRQAEIKRKRLETALTKIDSENFGLCDICKKTIQPKRLMFLPESTLCIHCASKR